MIAAGKLLKRRARDEHAPTEPPDGQFAALDQIVKGAETYSQKSSCLRPRDEECLHCVKLLRLNMMLLHPTARLC